jgi:hypothetical protein
MTKRAFTQSEIAQAKSFPIVELLRQYGHEPASIKNNTLMYLSPLRNEKTESFAVYQHSNSFFDFGTSTGGDVVKLAMLLLKISFVEAIKVLLSQNFFFISPKHTPTVAGTPKPHETKERPSIESVKPLQGKHFENYIKARKISFDFSQEYLKAIYYKTSPEQKKCFFGIGMMNNSGGYEIKNCQTEKYYCIGSKDATFLNYGFENTCIFEGMFDFLACLTYYNRPLKANVIILHSVSNINKILEAPPVHTKELFLLLDNDTAGDQATTKLSEHFSQFFGVRDCRYIYQGFKDFGEMVMR